MPCLPAGQRGQAGAAAEGHHAHGLGGGIARLCRRSLPQFPALDRAADRNIVPPPKAAQTASPCRNDTGVQEGGEISIFYDPMIAKLVHPCALAGRRHRGTVDRARCVLCRRHPPQHSIPVGADEPSALARRESSPPASSRRSFRRAFSAHTPEGEIARRIAAVGAAIDHVLGERKRQISGQLIGRPVQARKPPRGVARP